MIPQTEVPPRELKTPAKVPGRRCTQCKFNNNSGEGLALCAKDGNNNYVTTSAERCSQYEVRK